jgi:RHS repeat-associated protein
VGPAWYFPIDYFPYGEERTSTANGTDKFGTYFRDGYGQDYADQRYYTSNFGRFWSPDPGGIATANPRNPGSWNRYAYTNGDPANYYDPAGTDDINAGCAAFDEAFCEGSTLESNDPMNTGVMAPPGLVNVQCSAMYGLGWEFGGGVAVAACTTSWEQYDELVDGPPNCESNFTDSELDFVAVNYDAAVSLGGQAGVPQDWILAWSANESNWGTSTLATKQGNYFGWHGGGNIQCPPGSNPIEGCFSSYYQSGYTALFSLQQFFRYGGLVGVPAGWILANQYNSGASAAQAFQALASAGYNRNSSYGATIAGQTWLGTVDAAENCLSSLGFLK